MGKPTGFLEIERHDRGYDPPAERLKHYKEFVRPLAVAEVAQQALRLCGDEHEACRLRVLHQILQFGPALLQLR